MDRQGTTDISRIRTFTADAARVKAAPAPEEVASAPSTSSASSPTDSSGRGENPPFHFIRSQVEEVAVPAKAPKQRINPLQPRAATVVPPPQREQSGQLSSEEPAKPVTLAVPELANQKESILSDHLRVFDIGDDDVGTGTIVKETRIHRQKLLPSIAAQIGGWFTKKQSAREARRAAVPKVTAPEQRAETITAAAAPGVLPESDDHARVREEVQRKPTVAPTASLAIKEKQAMPAPHWTYTVDEDGAPDESDHVTVLPPKPTVKPATQEMPTPNPSVTPQPIEEVQVPPPAPVVPVARPETTPSPSAIPEVASPAREVSAPLMQEIDEPEPAPPYVPTSSRSRGIYALVVASVVATFLGVAAGVYLVSQWQGGTVATTPTPTVSGPLMADQQVAVPLTPTAPSFLTALSEEASLHQRGFVYYYPTLATREGTIVPAPTSDVLSVLATQAPGSFQRAIASLSFGSADSARFLLIKTDGFEVSLSGMLQWERTLVNDLAPWFGTTPTSSFIDVTEGNRDMRVARRGDGTELVYFFLDRTTIVITENRTLSAQIEDRLR